MPTSETDQTVMRMNAELMCRNARAATARARLMCDRAAASRLTAQEMTSTIRRTLEAVRCRSGTSV